MTKPDTSAEAVERLAGWLESFHDVPRPEEVAASATLRALAAENARLKDALRDLLWVIEGDDLIPETVSYMRKARAALGDAT